MQNGLVSLCACCQYRYHFHLIFINFDNPSQSSYSSLLLIELIDPLKVLLNDTSLLTRTAPNVFCFDLPFQTLIASLKTRRFSVPSQHPQQLEEAPFQTSLSLRSSFGSPLFP